MDCKKKCFYIKVDYLLKAFEDMIKLVPTLGNDELCMIYTFLITPFFANACQFSCDITHFSDSVFFFPFKPFNFHHC